MADKKESSKATPSDSEEKELEKKLSSYEHLLDRLEQEREKIEKELVQDYKNARRYVRSHPEEGILLSFVGGLVFGLIIGKLTK